MVWVRVGKKGVLGRNSGVKKPPRWADSVIFRGKARFEPNLYHCACHQCKAHFLGENLAINPRLSSVAGRGNGPAVPPELFAYPPVRHSAQICVLQGLIPQIFLAIPAPQFQHRNGAVYPARQLVVNQRRFRTPSPHFGRSVKWGCMGIANIHPPYTGPPCPFSQYALDIASGVSRCAHPISPVLLTAHALSLVANCHTACSTKPYNPLSLRRIQALWGGGSGCS